jgi:hypothetical protein
MTIEALKEELAFFDQMRMKLLSVQAGQFALVKGSSLIGVFPTQMDAYVEGVRRFGRDAFLIKQIVEHETVEQVPVLASAISRAHI